MWKKVEELIKEDIEANKSLLPSLNSKSKNKFTKFSPSIKEAELLFLIKTYDNLYQKLQKRNYIKWKNLDNYWTNLLKFVNQDYLNKELSTKDKNVKNFKKTIEQFLTLLTSDSFKKIMPLKMINKIKSEIKIIVTTNDKINLSLICQRIKNFIVKNFIKKDANIFSLQDLILYQENKEYLILEQWFINSLPINLSSDFLSKMNKFIEAREVLGQKTVVKKRSQDQQEYKKEQEIKLLNEKNKIREIQEQLDKELQQQLAIERQQFNKKRIELQAKRQLEDEMLRKISQLSFSSSILIKLQEAQKQAIKELQDKQRAKKIEILNKVDLEQDQKIKEQQAKLKVKINQEQSQLFYPFFRNYFPLIHGDENSIYKENVNQILGFEQDFKIIQKRLKVVENEINLKNLIADERQLKKTFFSLFNEQLKKQRKNKKEDQNQSFQLNDLEKENYANFFIFQWQELENLWKEHNENNKRINNKYHYINKKFAQLREINKQYNKDVANLKKDSELMKYETEIAKIKNWIKEEYPIMAQSAKSKLSLNSTLLFTQLQDEEQALISLRNNKKFKDLFTSADQQYKQLPETIKFNSDNEEIKQNIDQIINEEAKQLAKKNLQKKIKTRWEKWLDNWLHNWFYQKTKEQKIIKLKQDYLTNLQELQTKIAENNKKVNQQQENKNKLQEEINKLNNLKSEYDQKVKDLKSKMQQKRNEKIKLLTQEKNRKIELISSEIKALETSKHDELQQEANRFETVFFQEFENFLQGKNNHLNLRTLFPLSFLANLFTELIWENSQIKIKNAKDLKDELQNKYNYLISETINKHFLNTSYYPLLPKEDEIIKLLVLSKKLNQQHSENINDLVKAAQQQIATKRQAIDEQNDEEMRKLINEQEIAQQILLNNQRQELKDKFITFYQQQNYVLDTWENNVILKSLLEEYNLKRIIIEKQQNFELENDTLTPNQKAEIERSLEYQKLLSEYANKETEILRKNDQQRALQMQELKKATNNEIFWKSNSRKHYNSNNFQGVATEIEVGSSKILNPKLFIELIQNFGNDYNQIKEEVSEVSLWQEPQLDQQKQNLSNKTQVTLNQTKLETESSMITILE